MALFARAYLIFILLVNASSGFSQIKFNEEFKQKMNKYDVQFSIPIFTLSDKIKDTDFKQLKNFNSAFGSKFLMFKNPEQKINVAFYIDSCYNHYNLTSEVRKDLPSLFGITDYSSLEFLSFNKISSVINSDEAIIFAPKDAEKTMKPFIDYNYTFVYCAYNNYTKGKIYYVFNLDGDFDGRIMDYSQVLIELTFNPHPSAKNMEPELIIPAGTNSSIYTLACSKSGSLFAYAGEQGSIIISKGDGSKELRTINAHSKQINKICFSDNEKVLASCSSDSTIKLWEIETGKLIKTLKEQNGSVNDIRFYDYDTKLISTSTDKTIKLWDVDNNRTFKTIQGLKFEPGKLDICPDNKAIIALSDGELVSLNLKTYEYSIFKTQLNKIVDIACPYSDIIFITDGISVKSHNLETHSERVITDETDSSFTMLTYKKFEDSNINLVMMTGHGFSQTLDYTKNTLINTFQYTNFGNNQIFFDLIYNPNYNLLFYSSTHYCLSYNLTSKEFHPIWGAGYIPRSIDIDDNSKILTINYGKGFGLGLLSLKNGRILWHSYGSKLEKNGQAKISKYSGNILSVSPENEISTFDYLQGKFIYKFTTSSNPTNFETVHNDSTFIYRINNEIHLHKPEYKSDKLITNEYSVIDNVLTLIKDSFIIAQNNQNIFLINLHNGEKSILDSQQQYHVIKTYYADDNNIAIRTSDTLISIYDLKSFKKISSFAGEKFTHKPLILSLNPSKSEIALSNVDNEIYVIDYNTKQLIKKWKPHTQSILGQTYSPDGRFLITCSNDYSIKFWETKNYTEVLKSYTVPLENNYITRTVNNPKSYYVASSNIQKKTTTTLAYFSYGNNILDLSDLDLEYNRPDIIADILGYESDEIKNAYKKLYEKRLKKLNITSPDDILTENRPILKPIYDFPPIVKTSKNKFFFQLYSPTLNFKSLKVTINDVPVFGINGAEIVDGAVLKNYNSLPIAFNLFLSNGENKISIKITNQDNIESIPYNVSIYYKNDSIVKPKLHIIAIGVSEFENQKFNLKYPAKDIRDFIKQFQNQKNVYSEIIVDTLINEMATLENINKLKNKILENHNEDSIDVNDKVILFFATHGMLDKNYDYYLATYNVNFDNPSENGLLYSEIETLLDKIPPRNKLVLIDACHSGEVDKDELISSKQDVIKNDDLAFRAASSSIYQLKEGILKNSMGLMKEMFMDLRKTSGATVISSAGGTEFAIEGDEWKNGVFTYSLINGLKYHKADANNDNKVYLSELKNYLEEEVPRITNGKQQPTSRTENVSNDILIWSNDFNEELASAIKDNDKNLVEKLIKDGADVSVVDTNRASLLMWAVMYSDLDMVKKLISLKADVNAKGIIYTNPEKNTYYGSLLAIAAAKNKLDILKYLIENQGLNVNECEINSQDKTQTGWTPLYYSVSNSNIETIKYLVSKGADVNLCCSADKFNATLLAFSKSNIETCKLLLSKGANILLTDTSLTSIVTQAAINPNIDVLKLAVSKYKQAINKPDINGLYPISYTVFFSLIENFKFLLNNGAKYDVVSNNGETILHLAVRSKNIDMIDEVLKIYPESINKQNAYGTTALIIAALKQDNKIVEHLCKKGADISIKNNDGYNLEYIAKYYEDFKLLELVAKHSK